MLITGVERDPEVALFKAKLLGSFLYFTQTFFKIKTGRDFVLSSPIGREPHQITIARELTKVFHLAVLREWMTLPPGHGKSTFFTYFFPWCFAHYPDCKFIYISYSADLAATHTANIKSVMELPLYRKLFGVEISSESSAKDNFMTKQGGAVKAYGSQGGITGQDAGLPNCDRFTGGVFMDDMHKPSEVFSDTLRQTVIDNYNQTIKPRPRGPNVCMIGIGHALHEDDLRNFLVTGRDGNKWDHLKLAAEDEVGNILAPNLTSREMLRAEKDFNPYVYWSQYQGEPQPAGGGIFKPEWFVLLEEYPDMLVTFLTVDTAESTSNHADYSVFSFWGIYEINHQNRATGQYGLHWIDCVSMRIEPANLEDELMSFYAKCLEFKNTPRFIAIEKKSTGTTLISTLNKIRGFEVRDIERTKASGNKVARYFEAQPYAAKRLISLPKYSNHTTECLDHMRKITANNTHAHDDICDTFYDAVKIGLIEKIVINQVVGPKTNTVVKDLANHFNRLNNARARVCRR
jgi:predicted phage terminase large subunit-like protein